MRIYLHIGPDLAATMRLQQVLEAKRGQLAQQDILYPRSPGGANHTRLFMASSDPDRVDSLRFNRGLAAPEAQSALYRETISDLTREVVESEAKVLILSAPQLGTGLRQRDELERLRDLLGHFSQDITIVAHVDDPARAFARHYAAQVFEGRAALPDRELELARAPDWWQACLEAGPAPAPGKGVFPEVQGAPFWLDYHALVAFWEDVFGPGTMRLRACPPDLFSGSDATEELRAAFDIAEPIGKADPGAAPEQPAAAWITRARRLNHLLMQMLASGKYVVPRQLWRGFMTDMQVDGAPLDPGMFAPLSARFAEPVARLALNHPGLATLHAPEPAPLAEADPTRGFRATQYLLAFKYRIDRATMAARRAQRAKQVKPEARSKGPSPEARAIMPPAAIDKYTFLTTSPFRPHDRIGQVNERDPGAPYDPAPPRTLPEGSSGRVIVGCMKNEAPYIVEWVAYHRAIGIDNFLIYTNDCSDGTSEILDRLQALGVLQHRSNDAWKGNSPQQHALNKALKEPVIRNAEWIIHIDVDEFINVRCGNGTLDDFLARVPDATNVAMTWRLFGHNGVTDLADDFVIDQFDTCAPKFCPKPHTAWGFKTMLRNTGAYAKLSCHRPNKLAPAFREQVRWVNGSGQDMTKEAAENGWRNSTKTIGYDLIQLNHYALRSAESFLVKRQRGRALHVDRSIGLNYWIRMDWGDVRDVTIKRNVPRLRAEYDRLMQDETLRDLHETGLAWHRAKAAELHGMPEFEDLYQQALKVKLNETERVAYALALDMES